jgi:glycosyltransferase involved in cell wall biosynthesis
MDKKQKILVVSPTLSGGSWLVEEKLLARLNHKKISVYIAALGRVYYPNKTYRYSILPYPHYDRWGRITEIHPIFNLIWNLPLIVLACFLVMYYRPKVVVYNGLPLALSISPLCRLLKIRTVLMFHSYIANYSKLTHAILSLFARAVDTAVVNSKGSFFDLASIISQKKIIINEHFAEEVFFKGPIRKKSSRTFTVFYVGRLDSDKLCYPLIQVAQKLAHDARFKFVFAGVGEYAREIKRMVKESSNISYLHYLSNREMLKKMYQHADVLWSYADKTYLSMPAVEALTSGTPIIIPYIQPFGKDNDPSVRIGNDVVPKKIGWLIDPNNQNEIRNLLLTLYRRKISHQTRLDCRAYAKMRYSKKNQDSVLIKINSFFASD